VFAAEMLIHGLADAMVTGVTRDYTQTLDDISKVIPVKDGNLLLALSILMKRERIVFIADTAIHANPTAQQIAEIAIQAADEVRKMGYIPRVALVSTSTFGHPDNHCSFDDVIKMRNALKILDSRKVSFEYDGEISPEVALNSELLKLYPFCRLSGPANILVMPNINTASVSVKLLEEFGRCISIGPVISGFNKPVYITRIGANSSEIFNGAVVASSRS
jgi:malate dehydrogenase (oxaloacetate-decarboxylating)(NADP+)